MQSHEAEAAVQSDWETQCQKLEDAGYSYSPCSRASRPRLTRRERTLLVQSYSIDEETGRERLRQLALARYADNPTPASKLDRKLEDDVFDERDDQLREIQVEAWRTYATNYHLLESGADSELMNEIPLYRWMGVSRTFPPKFPKGDESLEEIGSTPSMKTLWQMAAPLGFHPLLLMADDRCRAAIKALVEPSRIKSVRIDRETAEDWLQKLESAAKAFETASTNDEEVDALHRWHDHIDRFAVEIDCDSSGGRMGAHLAARSQDPEVLCAMTHFGHLLGDIAPEWLVTIDPFG